MSIKDIYIDPPYGISKDPDYCEKCQEEAFIQRLGKERYEWLAKLAEEEAQDGVTFEDR